MLEYWAKWLGRPLPPGNRLQRATERLEWFNESFPKGAGFSKTDAETRRLVADAVRTLVEAFIVAHAVVSRRARKHFTDQQLEAFLLGGDDPDAEGAVLPRSFQFEAVSLAQFVLSGASVKAAEPDFQILYHGEFVGMAVKRLRTKNPGGVLRNLRDAASQIRDLGIRGFILLGMDPWISDLTVETADEVGAAFASDIEDAEKALDKQKEKPHVLGVVARANWMSWDLDTEPPRFIWKEPQRFVGFVDADADLERFNEYFSGMQARWNRSLEEISKLLS